MVLGSNGTGVGKDLYLVMDEMSHKATTMCFNMLKFRKIKYLKLMNGQIVGMHMNGISSGAERICLKNIVFMQI